MPADHYVMDSDMKKVADSIRAKGGTTDPLQFPDGMVQAINDIQTGGDHEAEDGIVSGNIRGTYINDRVTNIGVYVFYNKYALITVEFPRVTNIGDYAFKRCGRLTTANFPQVTNIGDYAFQDCSSLTTADFANITSIKTFVFAYCSSLTTVNFPLAKSIGYNAFIGCSSLTTADFANITSIGTTAFKECSSLTKLIIRTPALCTASSNILGGSDKCQIYVPDNLVSQYKTATNWSKYASRIHGLSELPPE